MESAPQLELFQGQRKSSRQTFETWIVTPEGQAVFQWFCDEAKKWWFQGEKIGAKAIWEYMRYMSRQRRIDKAPGETYKLNNNYHSKVARLAMETVPELKGFFETRS